MLLLFSYASTIFLPSFQIPWVTRGGKDCGGETLWTEEGGEEGPERPTLQRRGTTAEGEKEEEIFTSLERARTLVLEV